MKNSCVSSCKSTIHGKYCLLIMNKSGRNYELNHFAAGFKTATLIKLILFDDYDHFILFLITT